MKRIAIEELARKVDVLVKVAPNERVLLTLDGQPFAFVSDASSYDWEDIAYMTDPAFWKMIEERRKEKGSVPLEQIRAELVGVEKAANRSSKPMRPTRKARTKRRRPAA